MCQSLKNMEGGHNLSHVEQHFHRDLRQKSRGTDGGSEEKPSLRGAAEGVTALDPLSHASTATDVLSPCPA